MIGAILGDIIGSPYEFDRGNKSKEFPLFTSKSTYTDDTVMTLAVGLTFLDAQPSASDDWILRILANHMRQFGKMYPNAGYGGMFRQWLSNPECKAYNSFGNGSAMRVSSVAWLYNDIDAVRHAARLSAEVTHNHPEGIKGAEATASAIFLARIGHSKAEIKEYIEHEFGYELNRSCDEIRPGYFHTETCMETVPEAITAFLEGDSFEDVIRTAVSLGGDCDTLTAIAGSIAEGYYGVPAELKEECYKRLPEPLLKVLREFEEYLAKAEAVTNDTADCVQNIYGGEKSGIYFRRTRSGNQSIVRVDGSYTTMKKRNEYFAEMGGQALEGWQRANLYMKEFGIWDATAFGCTMNTAIAFTFLEYDKEYALIFSSCECAERYLYKDLPEDVVSECRKNVDSFYANPDLQKKWEWIILHPICLKYVNGSGRFVPVSLADIHITERMFKTKTFRPVGMISNIDELEENLFKYLYFDINEAIRFATERHAGQKRKGTDTPYIVHPMEVMTILSSMNAEEETMIAGVLHDTVEDTETTIDEIERLFGSRVSRLVELHSEDKSKTWQERKKIAIDRANKANIEEKKLILADKLSNLRAICRDYELHGEELWKRFNAGPEKQAWYYGAMADALEALAEDKSAREFYGEYVSLCKTVFAKIA